MKEVMAIIRINKIRHYTAPEDKEKDCHADPRCDMPKNQQLIPLTNPTQKGKLNTNNHQKRQQQSTSLEMRALWLRGSRKIRYTGTYHDDYDAQNHEHQYILNTEHPTLTSKLKQYKQGQQ